MKGRQLEEDPFLFDSHKLEAAMKNSPLSIEDLKQKDVLDHITYNIRCRVTAHFRLISGRNPEGKNAKTD